MRVHYLERLDAVERALDHIDNARSGLLDPIDTAALDEAERVLRRRRRHLHEDVRDAHAPAEMVPRRSMGPCGGALQGRHVNPNSYPKNRRLSR